MLTYTKTGYDTEKLEMKRSPTTTPLHVRVTRKSILVKMSNIRSLHQLYASITLV